jgi:hypothetical protein
MRFIGQHGRGHPVEDTSRRAEEIEPQKVAYEVPEPRFVSVSECEGII